MPVLLVLWVVLVLWSFITSAPAIPQRALPERRPAGGKTVRASCREAPPEAQPVRRPAGGAYVGGAYVGGAD